MGPGNGSSASRDSLSMPSRPRFSWDIRNVPWTDGKGNQEEYARSVSLWKKFHDKLPVTNSNKVPAELQGIMLQSQLYGRARDLCKTLSDDKIESATGALEIVNAVYKRDALAIVSEVFQDFQDLLATKGGLNETFKNFESRFNAQVSKFNAHSDSSKLPEALTAFMLLVNANVNNSQRISVMAASSTRDATFPSNATTKDFLDSVSYESFASVIRQCEKSNSQEPASIYANASMAKSKYATSTKKRLSPENLRALKAKSKCHKCKMYGHWMTDHNQDGTLKPGVRTTQLPEVGGSGNPTRGPMTFNMAKLCDEEDQTLCTIGPLLDDGAPYSGIGMHEFKLIQPMIMPDWDEKVEGLPDPEKNGLFGNMEQVRIQAICAK